MKQTLKQAKKKYPGEWLAFLVTDEGDKPDELIGEVLIHKKDRREVHEQLRRKKVKNAYITYAGPLIKPGYSVMFNETNNRDPNNS
jgi:hypothetical protein